MSRSIGAVVAELRGEFPDLRESKVRFLEAEGLIAPERTSAGYRRYTDADVIMLRRVLRLQRDNFWPLKVIAEHIRSGAPDQPDEGAESATRARPVRRGGRIGRETLLARVQIAPSVLQELESYGLVAPDAAGRFGDVQVEIAAVVARLIDFGVQPRHLRPMRVAADREVGLVHQAVAALGSSKERAGEVIELLVRLHAALLWSGVGHDAPGGRG